MDSVNTSTSQIDSLSPTLITLPQNPYGTGPAFSLSFPVSTQGVNGTIGFKTLLAYFVRIGGIGTRYNLFIDINNLTAVSVELEAGMYSSYPSNGYSTEDPRVDASGVFVIVKDTSGGRNTLYMIRITGLGGGPPAPTILTRGTGASSSLQFNPALGGVVQPSLEPVPPLPSALLQAGTTTPCLIIKSGGQTKSYYPPKNRTRVPEFSPVIFIEAIASAQNQNFGEVFFTVFDIKPHKGTFNGQNPSFQAGDTTVYASQFSRFPQFNVVVKGNGCTLQEKFLWLIERYRLLTTVENFTAHMALYSYAKYVLAGLLNCDHFSAKWLSRCYNREFMRLLEESRFSDFSVLFNDKEIGLVGFQRYFHCLPDGCN